MKVVQCIVNIAHIAMWAILTMCNVTFSTLSWKRCSLNIVWAAKLRGGGRGGGGGGGGGSVVLVTTRNMSFLTKIVALTSTFRCFPKCKHPCLHEEVDKNHPARRTPGQPGYRVNANSRRVNKEFTEKQNFSHAKYNLFPSIRPSQTHMQMFTFYYGGPLRRQFPVNIFN